MVLPLVEYFPPDAKRPAPGVVYNIVAESETAAAMAAQPHRSLDVFGMVRSGSYWESDPRDKAAHEAINSAAYAGVVAIDDERPERAFIAMNYAAGAAGPIADIRPDIRRDFDLVAALATSESWTDDTHVPPEIFGPVWPCDPPRGWPDLGPEPNSENSELVVTIDVPEGMSDAQVLELVAGLAVKADAIHRAYGGHGLEVEEGNVEIDREVVQPTPAGGRS
jgi:hypothetical protein